MTRITMMSTTLGLRQPYKIVTVSRYPEKATLMVKRLAETFNDKYIFIHAANCERIEEVKFRVRDLQPDMLAWSSSLTPEQIDLICNTAQALKADVEMCPLPEDSPSQKSVDVLSSHIKNSLLSALNQ